MAVIKVFDEDSLVVEPHELTDEDRAAFSRAIAESKASNLNMGEISSRVRKIMDRRGHFQKRAQSDES